MSDHHVCEDCELETLGPDDHKCPNPECPSHEDLGACPRPCPACGITGTCQVCGGAGIHP